MKTRGGGKAKGSAFERQIAKEIVKNFRKKGITQRDCWRSINSGGHLIACGDLEMSEKLIALFPFAVEAKFRKKIKWQNFMLGGKNEEMSWVRQAREGAAKDSRLQPLLVMKENFGKVYVIDDFHNPFQPQLKTWRKFLKDWA